MSLVHPYQNTLSSLRKCHHKMVYWVNLICIVSNIIVSVHSLQGIPIKSSFHDAAIPQAQLTSVAIHNALPSKTTQLTPELKHNVKGKGRDFLDFDISENFPDRKEDQGGEARHLVNFYHPNNGIDYMKLPAVHHQHSTDVAQPNFRFHYTPDSDSVYDENHMNHHDDTYAGDSIEDENTLSKFITPAVYENLMSRHNTGHRRHSLFGDPRGEYTEHANTDRFFDSLKSLMTPLPDQMNQDEEPDYDDIMKGFHGNSNYDRTESYGSDRQESESPATEHGGDVVKNMNNEANRNDDHDERSHEDPHEFGHESRDYHNEISDHEPYHHNDAGHEPDSRDYNPGESRSDNFDSHRNGENPHDYVTGSHEQHIHMDNDIGDDTRHEYSDSYSRHNDLNNFRADSSSYPSHEGPNSDYSHFSRPDNYPEHSSVRHYQEGTEHRVPFYRHEQEGEENRLWDSNNRGGPPEERGASDRFSEERSASDRSSEERSPVEDRGSLHWGNKDISSHEGRSSSPEYLERGQVDETRSQERGSSGYNRGFASRSSLDHAEQNGSRDGEPKPIEMVQDTSGKIRPISSEDGPSKRFLNVNQNDLSRKSFGNNTTNVT